MSNNFNRATISQHLQTKTNQLKQIEQNALTTYQADLNQQYQNALNHSMSDFAQTLTSQIGENNERIMIELSKYDTIPQTIADLLNSNQAKILELFQNFLSQSQAQIQSLAQSQDRKMELVQSTVNQSINDLEQWKADTTAQLTTNKQLPLATWIALITLVGIGAVSQLTLIIINGKTWLWLSLCLAIIVLGVAVWAVVVAIKKANSENE